MGKKIIRKLAQALYTRKLSNKRAFLFVTFILAHLLARPQAAMRLVSGGTFQMGDALGVGEKDEQPVHTVQVERFYIGIYEVTFEEYDRYCAENWAPRPEDNGWGRGLRPVINVSWYDAILYCNRRSIKEGLTPCYTIDKTIRDLKNQNLQDLEKWVVSCDFNANGYRLPTEAEWEFAARGGTQGKGWIGAGGVGVDSVGWYAGNAVTKTRPVGQKKPNELEIYDMSGNVWEWCWDWYASGYSTDAKQTKSGPEGGALRGARGGSWEDGAEELRAANRHGFNPSARNLRNVGFRIVRTTK